MQIIAMRLPRPECLSCASLPILHEVAIHFSSLHSVLQEELQHNIFLRCSEPEVAAAMGKDPGSSTLAELRWRKDNWGLVASATTMALLLIQTLPLAAWFFGLDH